MAKDSDNKICTGIPTFKALKDVCEVSLLHFPINHDSIG